MVLFGHMLIKGGKAKGEGRYQPLYIVNPEGIEFQGIPCVYMHWWWFIRLVANHNCNPLTTLELL